MNITSSSSPGRICFAGEDIDWISGPSILCAINLRIDVFVTGIPASHSRLEIKTSGSLNDSLSISIDRVGQYSNHILDYVNAAVKVLIDVGLELSPVQIEIRSDLPANAGLSSSAAVSVAVIKALSGYFGLEINNYQIAHLAYLVEKDELKTGAGQMDQYSCSLGGIIYLNSSTIPPSEIETFTFPSGIELIIVDTLNPRSTADIICMKRRRYARREIGIMTYVAKAEALTQDIRKIIKQPDLDFHSLGKLVTACHETLRDDMRVSTPLLEACVSACLENGAFGAKITGTGMGGCMFALLHPGNSKRVQSALSALPVRIYVTTPSADGVVIR